MTDEALREAEHLLRYIVLAVCDPREAVKGNLPSAAKAVEAAIDRMQKAEAENEALRRDRDAADRFLETERNNHKVSIAEWEKAEERVAKLEKVLRTISELYLGPDGKELVREVLAKGEKK